MRISDWSSDVCSSDLNVTDESPHTSKKLFAGQSLLRFCLNPGKLPAITIPVDRLLWIDMGLIFQAYAYLSHCTCNLIERIPVCPDSYDQRQDIAVLDHKGQYREFGRGSWRERGVQSGM